MGSNSQQAFEVINQGFGMFQDIQKQLAPPEGSGRAQDEARLLETDARGEALEAQRQAKKEARRVRDARERERSGERATWGGSNLAMSGSKALVRDAQSTKDMQEEEDVLFEGQRNADAILNNARNRANMLRINGGASPNRSTLSMGSKIYGPRS